jgi:asparagine synthase (glutamine-hydrolysing)
MCGIAGRFHPVHLSPDPGWAARADQLLAHRGPDGQGHYADERCELVHRRLALIDLSPSGHQPMTNEDGSVLVVFNGEIYNHQQLRAGLAQAGHTFRGTSDTEVLVHLYEECGEAMVRELRGIFAFALYDRWRAQVILARDRFGVKPLYYAPLGEECVFASEMKAITALGRFRPELDRQACYDFLGLGYVPEPATGFANIHALAPGTTLVLNAAGCRVARYHRVAVRPDLSARLPETVASVSSALLEAVSRQAVADVPVAALLSGGIDSSLVVAAHSRATGRPTTTFNVRFPDRTHDETAAAHAVAGRYGTRHHTIELGDWALTPEAIFDLLRHFDQPFADTSLFPTYWISRAVREHGIICTLSGDGGDEAFGGYGRFWRANRLAQLMAWPGWLLDAAGATGARLAGWTRDLGRQVAKAARFAQAGASDSAVLIAGLSNYLTEHEKQALVRPAARDGLATAYRHFDGYVPRGTTALEELSRRLTDRLFAVSLPADMLRKVDMMSMRASIEVRVPLLDEALVALGLALPHRLKTDGTSGKRVLRELARRWLPRSVAQHPKHGFTIPLDVMAPAGLHDALADLLLGPDARTRAVLDTALVASWLGAFRRAQRRPRGGVISRGGLYQRVFMILALELWLRHYRLSW